MGIGEGIAAEFVRYGAVVIIADKFSLITYSLQK